MEWIGVESLLIQKSRLRLKGGKIPSTFSFCSFGVPGPLPRSSLFCSGALLSLLHSCNKQRCKGNTSVKTHFLYSKLFFVSQK